MQLTKTHILFSKIVDVLIHEDNCMYVTDREVEQSC